MNQSCNFVFRYSDKRNTEVAKMLKTMLNEEFGDGYSQAIIQSVYI